MSVDYGAPLGPVDSVPAQHETKEHVYEKVERSGQQIDDDDDDNDSDSGEANPYATIDERQRQNDGSNAYGPLPTTHVHYENVRGDELAGTSEPTYENERTARQRQQQQLQQQQQQPSGSVYGSLLPPAQEPNQPPHAQHSQIYENDPQRSPRGEDAGSTYANAQDLDRLRQTAVAPTLVAASPRGAAVRTEAEQLQMQRERERLEAERRARRAKVPVDPSMCINLPGITAPQPT